MFTFSEYMFRVERFSIFFGVSRTPIFVKHDFVEIMADSGVKHERLNNSRALGLYCYK